MKDFGAIELEILWQRLISILDEVDQIIVRTTFSTILSESRDFACILTKWIRSHHILHDPQGRLCLHPDGSPRGIALPVRMELTQFLCGSAPDRPGVAAPLSCP